MRPLFRYGLVGLAGLPYVVALFSNSTYAAPVQQASSNSFKDVAGIFKAHCNSCHTGKTASAGLDLSTPQGILKGGISGKLFAAGKPGTALLMKRVLGQGGLPAMPMGFAPLSKEQLATLKGWIAAGGKIDTRETAHWAYVYPKAYPVPATKSKAWIRNPIDSFILARLEKGMLTPSPTASKETLIRRVSLDLTGLPPTLEEIDAFLADTSPDAYEKVVDRLLASPHYGERQARIWLDLARYADTHGYEKDGGRVAWKYRDWVINAYNQNMPYDEFTIEQLAGDLLPNPSLEQLIATGFHRNTMLNTEGGVDPNEARYEMVTDRVATTSTVWLSQTVQCARCHDHKYDPISQKDFFRMYAIFDNTTHEARGDNNVGEQKFFEKDMPAPSSEQVEQKKELEGQLAVAENAYRASTPEYQAEKATWLNKIKTAKPWAQVEIEVEGLARQPDGSFLASGNNPGKVTYKAKVKARKGDAGLRLVALPDPSLPANGPGRSGGGNFVLSSISANVKLLDPVADFVQNGFRLADLFDNDPNTGWAVSPQSGQEHWLSVRFESPLAEDQTLEVTLACVSTNWPDHSIGRFRFDTTQKSDRLVLGTPGKMVQLASSNPEGPEIDAYFRTVANSMQTARTTLAKAREDLANLNRQIPMAMIMTEKSGNAPLRTPFHPRGEFLQVGDLVTSGIPAAFGKTEAKRVDRLVLAKWLVSKSNPLTARVQVNRMWEQFFGRGIVDTSDNFGTPGSKPSHPELFDWLALKFMDTGWDMKAMSRLIVTSATYRQSSNVSKALLERDPANILVARGPRFRMEAEMIRDNALAAAGMLNLQIGGPSVFPHQPEGIWNSPYNGERWMTSKGDQLYRRGIYTYLKRTAPYPTFINFDGSPREVCVVTRGRTNTPLQALNLLNDPAFLEAAKGLARRVMGTPEALGEGVGHWALGVGEAEGLGFGYWVLGLGTLGEQTHPNAQSLTPNATTSAQHPTPNTQNPQSSNQAIQQPSNPNTQHQTPSTPPNAQRPAPNAISLAFRLCTARHPKPAELDRLVALYNDLLAKYQQKPEDAKKLGSTPEEAAMVMVASVLLNLDETINKE